MLDVSVKLLTIQAYLSTDDYKKLMEELKLVRIKKGEVLEINNNLNARLWLVVSGSFFQYYCNTDNEIDVHSLYIEDDLILNLESLIFNKHNEYVIKANEDSILYELRKESIFRLIKFSKSYLRLPGLFKLGTSRLKIIERYNSSDKKYLHLLIVKPSLIQKFSQRMIASYLKMTPETLSRVKKRIVMSHK